MNLKEVLKIKDGKIIKVYRSAALAGRENQITQSNMSGCLARKKRAAGGFEWMFKSDLHSPTKVCWDRKCESNGRRQSRKNFRIDRNNVDNCSHQCRACIYAESNIVSGVKEIEQIGEEKWLIDFVKYKIGTFGLVFYKPVSEWIKSDLSVDQLMRTVKHHLKSVSNEQG